VQRGVSEHPISKHLQINRSLQKDAIDQAIDIFIVQITSRRYVQSWIDGYYYNPLFGDDPYMAGLVKVPPQ
jgi:hypothetical protein